MLSIRLGLTILCLSSGALDAQEAGQSSAARELLTRADAALFQASTVRLAGTRTIASDAPGVNPIESAFSLDLTRDGRVRNDEGAGNTQRLQIFDGTTLTDYSASTHSYAQSAASSAPATALWLINLLRFGSDPWNIASASIEREESTVFGGKATPCQVVRAAYNGIPSNATARNVVRTACIARESGILLRDTWEMDLPGAGGTTKSRSMFQYTTIEWDSPLPDGLFAFVAPEGSHPAARTPPITFTPPQVSPLPKATPGSGQTYKVALPVVRRRPAPEYTEEARAANLQGTVLVSVEVDEEGRPAHARVVRGLGMGLDEKALQAVRDWQFRPGTKDGKPVRMLRPYDVDFVLSEGGPWRVTGASYGVQPPRTDRPVPIAIVKPSIRRYASPDAAACSGNPGFLTVHLAIGADGSPSNVQAVKGRGDAIAPAAVAAIRSWTFDPATANKKRVPADATIILECVSPDGAASPDNVVSSPDNVGPVFNVGGGVSAPALIFKIEPEYSEEARQAKFAGAATISLVVAPNGRPARMVVVRSPGLGLDEKALEALAQWRFQPGMKDGKPVAVGSTVQVNFKLM